MCGTELPLEARFCTNCGAPIGATPPLRPDVAWSDGDPVTAHDFDYASRRVLDPVTRSRAANVLYD